MSSLQVSKVSRYFGGVSAVEEVSLTAEASRITGLIGPNGAGKTTMINLITGLLKASSGRIFFEDKDITSSTPQDIARCGIARTFQNIRLLRQATVLQNIIAGYHRHEKTGIFSNMLGLPAARKETRHFHEEAMELLCKLNMSTYADFQAGTLSYGHQRRVEILRALATNPKLILLDEPVAGMNEKEADELGVIFERLASDGIAILLIEHNVGLVMAICNTVYVLDSGKLIASGKPADVGSNADVIKAYIGE